MFQLTREFLDNAHLITHANCLDGAGTEIVWNVIGGDNNLDVSRVAAGAVDDWYYCNFRRLDGENLLFCDVSPKLHAVWKDFSKRHGQTVVLDHHETSRQFEKYPQMHHSYNEKSGAMMMFEASSMMIRDKYDIIVHDDLYDVIEAIHHHDTWNEVTSDVTALAVLMKSLGYSEFVKRFSRNPTIELCYEEKFLIKHELRRLDEKLERTLKNVIRFDLCEYICGAVFVDEDNSRLLDQLLQRNSNVDVALGVNVLDGSMSLRSRKDGPVDCSLIAQKYGGGGHKNAAGFVKPVVEFTKSIVELFE